MINTKQVVPALVAVTLLSLAPAAEALAIEEHAQAAKPAAVAADKPAAAKPAEAKADTKTDAKADVKTQAPAATDPAKETPAPQLSRPKKPMTTAATKKHSLLWNRSLNWSTPTPNTCSARCTNWAAG